MYIQEYTSHTNNLKQSNNLFMTNTDIIFSTQNTYMSISGTVHNNYASFRLLDLNRHTKNIVQLEEQGDNLRASAYALIWLEFILKDYDFRSINYIFENMEIEKLDEWSIVSILRTTAFARQNIPAWNVFLKRCCKALILKEKDPNRILVGML